MRNAIIHPTTIPISPPVKVSITDSHKNCVVMSLFLAPIASAYTAFALSQLARSKNKNWRNPKMHSLCAFLFALALTTIRFTYAQR